MATSAEFVDEKLKNTEEFAKTRLKVLKILEVLCMGLL